MEVFDLGLVKLGLFDVIDIVLVAFIIYQIYNLIRGTIAVNIFIGLLLIYGLWIGVKALNMQLLSGILDKVIGLGLIALLILFQQEIRRFLLLIGKNAVSNCVLKVKISFDFSELSVIKPFSCNASVTASLIICLINL